MSISPAARQRGMESAIAATLKIMFIYKTLHTRIKAAVLTVLIIAISSIPTVVSAELLDETLGLYSGWQESSVSAGRAPKPISQTAENVTVITASDIESLNAHTLADILATVSGVQVDMHGGPGGLAYTYVQSAMTNHVQILVDGVAINNLSENFSDVGLVPAQIIERIEIVKGAASSAWGQALGGVINVITKSPNQRHVSGEASASTGSRNTNDVRGELTGTVDKFGYYLSGGYLGTDGLLPDNQIYSSNGHAKLSLELPGHAELWGTFAYNNANRNDFSYLPIDARGDNSTRYLTLTSGYRKQIFEGLDLAFVAHHNTRQLDISMSLLSTGELLQLVNTREQVSGGNGQLTWRTRDNLLVVGGEYEHAKFRSTTSFVAVARLERVVDRWGLYANNSFTINPVTVSGGIRLDHTASSGNQVSPSIGATLQLNDSTVLRVYTAKGFSLPSIYLDRPSEKVWTLQSGIETSAIPYLWLKGSLFRNEIWDVTARDPLTGDRFSERRIALGVEAELRTVPVFNTSLGAGYTFTDTTRTSDGSQVLSAPRHTAQLALRYDDKHFLRGALTGRHIYWNADPAFAGRYRGMIWDLHVGATVFKREDTSLELFFSGRNLFNGSLYQDEAFQIPKRWFEGGIKVRF